MKSCEAHPGWQQRYEAILAQLCQFNFLVYVQLQVICFEAALPGNPAFSRKRDARSLDKKTADVPVNNGKQFTLRLRLGRKQEIQSETATFTTKSDIFLLAARLSLNCAGVEARGK